MVCISNFCIASARRSRASSPNQSQARYPVTNTSLQQPTTPMRPNSPGFGSATRRFTTPFSEPPVIPRSGAPITPTSYKEGLGRSGSASRGRPDGSAVKALQSSQSTSSSNSGHSGHSGGPQTDFEYDSDLPTAHNRHQARAALTAEDLRIRYAACSN